MEFLRYNFIEGMEKPLTTGKSRIICGVPTILFSKTISKTELLSFSKEKSFQYFSVNLDFFLLELLKN
ncbi:hypothetical protein LEP1GSC062_2106 [Leptospira alexanderi serovar Manhao 3 str. L 60]|uniref:Uncharacterized protein n=1 Tax=Leptospira alexanderi serovar Manhao 3 str. L 60 TaxID=1049759 RepID=V6HWZ9_9LEPT|nr:hypothetical protein LEP1GSC062_2106 [Leptospira alexanderi serovar Manhao 3 str. L 60]